MGRVEADALGHQLLLAFSSQWLWEACRLSHTIKAFWLTLASVASKNELRNGTYFGERQWVQGIILIGVSKLDLKY